MKAGELKKILSFLDEDSDVCFTIGLNDEERAKYAMLELTRGDCLEYMTPRSFELLVCGDLPALDIHLTQDNHFKKTMDEAEQIFAKKYIINPEYKEEEL